MGLQLNDTLALNQNRPAAFDPMTAIKNAQSIADMIQANKIRGQQAGIQQQQAQQQATQFDQGQQDRAAAMQKRNAILGVINSPEAKGPNGEIDYDKILPTLQGIDPEAANKIYSDYADQQKQKRYLEEFYQKNKSLIFESAEHQAKSIGSVFNDFDPNDPDAPMKYDVKTKFLRAIGVGSDMLPDQYDPATSPHRIAAAVNMQAELTKQRAPTRTEMIKTDLEKVKQGEISQGEFVQLHPETLTPYMTMTEEGRALKIEIEKAIAESRALGGTSSAVIAGEAKKTGAKAAAQVAAEMEAAKRQIKELELTGIDPSTNKPYTADQFLAGTYAFRMNDANQTLADLEKGGYDPGAIKNAVMNPDYLNLIKDPQQRQCAQAMRSFINATLRRESGAAIAESEFESGRKQYFAQPGDDAETLEKKRKTRLQTMSGFKAQARGAYDLVKQQYQAELAPGGGTTQQNLDGSPKALPTLTPSEAAKLQPGTHFLGTDGQEHVRK